MKGNKKDIIIIEKERKIKCQKNERMVNVYTWERKKTEQLGLT